MAGVLLSGSLLLSACATSSGYLNHTQASLAPPDQKAATSDKAMYLDLIRQMQQQGAYYASLAHIDAFRQRYGNLPELRLLQADALRETGQDAQADKVYEGLRDSDQAGAAWHGIGLIAARGGDHARAELALSKAVEIEPINVSYLGDLGYERLQVGQLQAAQEPLAKAAELAPGNVKAISNLALWMLLGGNYAQADAVMQRANLPQPAREDVRRLAVQLRVAPQVPRTAPPAVARTDASRQVTPPQQETTQPPSLSAQVAGIPGSMLERLGSSSTASEAQP